MKVLIVLYLVFVRSPCVTLLGKIRIAFQSIYPIVLNSLSYTRWGCIYDNINF